MNTAEVKRVFWRTWPFWGFAILIVVSCLTVGYLIGSWQTGLQARAVINQQETAYREAGDARKAVMEQCLTNNAKLNSQLAAVGLKASNAASDAAEALNKLSGDTPKK